jgi:hypothetical protein
MIQRVACETLSRLLQELLREEATWDSRFTWFDGIVASGVNISDDLLEITGGAFVVDDHNTATAPVRVTLQLGRSEQGQFAPHDPICRFGAPSHPIRARLRISPTSGPG